MTSNTPPPPPPPPGWFPDQANGDQVRWWDGEAWTERIQPSSAAGTGVPEHLVAGGGTAAEGASTAPAKKPWYFRWWVITAAVLVALSVFGNLLPDETPAEPKPVATDSPSSDEPTAEPSQSAEEIEAERQETARQAREEKRVEAEKKRAEQAAAEKARKAAAAEQARQEAAEAARVNPATYRTVSDRDLALIVKNPDAHVGEKIVLHGYVTQSDSVTGPKNLLADVSATPGYEWYDFETNSLVSAPGPILFRNVVEDDLVTFYVEVVGSYSYDTQAGGNTTVPQFLANIARVTGSVA